jgi:hypothetical protein
MPTSEFYRARADQCQREADAASLDNVRERQMAARDAWLTMAERIERTSVGRAEVAEQKRRIAEAELMSL